MKRFRSALAAALIAGVALTATPAAQATTKAEADFYIKVSNATPCTLVKEAAKEEGLKTRSDVYNGVKKELSADDTTAEHRKQTERVANSFADRAVKCEAVKNDLSGLSSGSSFSLSSR
ncbi:MAG: hypothetical protein Q4G50_00870 [Corynebacterium sp.]|uniref:hypothetical protein n=1 Tax=Corynebacterium sp. TaxID=1720 RepID=UPI0026E0E388|nr:hypothetical protein [Corynebacterium sp.]MDO5668534.1 hypothetical protein [Corynebacterium sp.]